MDPFEHELKQALERRPAPPNLKGRILQRQAQRTAERRHHRSALWMRMAASLAICAVLSGVADWGVHQSEERRKGEEARRQVLAALRITGRELNHVQLRLASHDRERGY